MVNSVCNRSLFIISSLASSSIKNEIGFCINCFARIGSICYPFKYVGRRGKSMSIRHDDIEARSDTLRSDAFLSDTFETATFALG